VGFFSAAGEGSGPATFEEVLRLAAPTPTGFAEFVGNQFPVLHAADCASLLYLRLPPQTVDIELTGVQTRHLALTEIVDQGASKF
jgi:hypothetical protein